MEDELTDEELDRAIEMLEYALRRIEEEALLMLCTPVPTHINTDDVFPN